MRPHDPEAVAADRNHWRERANVIRERLTLYDVVSKVVALKHRTGPEYVGLCPFHDEKTGSFTVNTKKNFYHCFGCGAHGTSPIDFVMARNGQDFKDAIQLLESQNGLARFAASTAPKKATVKQADDGWKQTVVDRIAAQTVDIRPGSPVDRYLRGRNLVPTALYGFGDMAVNGGWPTDLRFHAELEHPDTKRRYLAMVGLFRQGDSRITAVHRTYLRIEGDQVVKAGTGADKLHLGNRRGTVIRLAEIQADMGGGEGIETTLSAMQLERKAGLVFGAADGMRVVELPFLVERFTYWADWNAQSRVGEKAAWTGARLQVNATGRAIAVKVPNLRHLPKADFNNLDDRLRATVARYLAEAERRSGVAA